MHAGQGRTKRDRALAIAMWSAHHARVVIPLWLALTIGLFLGSLALGGMRTANELGATSQTDAARAAALQAGGGAAGEEIQVTIGNGTVSATDPAFRAVVLEVRTRLLGATAVIDGRDVAAVSGLDDPYAAPSELGLIAPDLAAVRVVGHLDGDTKAAEARARAIAPVLAALRADHPGWEIHAVGTSLLVDQMAEEINRDMDSSLLLTLPATFLILVLAFGAVVAAGVPLVLATTALLAAFGLVGLFSLTVEPISPYAGQFIVLIGLAVAIDYSLFVITRFRAERRGGSDKFTAIRIASETSGRAVLFSGVAVMISLAALLTLADPLFQSIAIGTIAAIAVSVAGSLVFLPAVLAVLGDAVDRGRVPFLRGGGARVWTSAVARVTRRPVAAALFATVVLLALASPVLRLRLGETDITSFPDRIDAVRAVQTLQAHWPQGALLRLDVVVTNADDPAVSRAISRLEPALAALPGLAGPARVASPSTGIATVSVLMSGGQNDPANWDLVRRIRSGVIPAVFGGTAAQVYVGGAAAASLDQTGVYDGGMPRVVAFVLALSFVLLLLVFRSIAIPAKAILLNLLATGAAFGSMTLVFQDGWFGSLLGVRPTDAIQNFVPVFVFTTLFGLSMDYEVFILSRVREAVDRGLTTAEAVERGIAATAGTVTSAAAIMVVVFGVFLTLPLPIARELGLGMMVAVFVDATIIRTVLLPATMHLLGEWNWWMPGFLRRLPAISIEHAPDASDGAGATDTVHPVRSGAPAIGSELPARLRPTGTTDALR